MRSAFWLHWLEIAILHGLRHCCAVWLWVWHDQAWGLATPSPTGGWCYQMPPDWEGCPLYCCRLCKLLHACLYIHIMVDSYVLTCFCSLIWSVWTWSGGSCPSGRDSPYPMPMWNSWAKGSRSVSAMPSTWGENSLNLLQPAWWYVYSPVAICSTKVLSLIRNQHFLSELDDAVHCN
jgi:hypothetical protein